jgi:peroxiredoxin
MRLWRLTWPVRAWFHKGLEPGSVFPDFALRDTRGSLHRLSEGAGAALTVLWFTNLCEDCRGRIPLLEDLVRQAGGRVRVLALSILAPDDPLHAQVAPRCPFPLLLDPEDVVGRRLGLAHPPGACPLLNLYILTASGRVLFRHHLSALEPAEFAQRWRDLLAERSGGGA